VIPRLYIAAGAALAVILALGYAKVTHDASERLRARLEAAEQQANIATETTRIIERTMTNERTIEREADRAVQAVQEAPGAETPIPPELLDVWGRALGGLRDNPGAGPASDPR
jgi:hypothetical protein